jgi:ribonuclease Z
MNAIGKSSVVFVTLSGLFWGGWILGSQTPEGQEALARAYQAYTDQETVANQDLFSTTALRAIVCGQAGVANIDQKPCLAVVAAGRLFIVDAGSGAAASLAAHGISTQHLQAVLLTSAGLTQTADLDELYGEGQRSSSLLPVYGPGETQRLVDGLNQAAGFDGLQRGLQAWGPSPEPGRSVIVFDADGLVISAFTTREDAFAGRVGYRFDYRGRSIVVGGDGRIADAPAAANADVVLEGARSQQFGQLHARDMATPAEVAASAQAANAGMLVLTGARDEVAAQMQVAEARAAGYDAVRAGRVGMVVELPLDNSEVNVRSL